ncbi:LysM peptidoglycan-binding domain-containing protein [Lacticigenium naphthae]|uniref:LysM peptidoglycan-binding domain-containing protein n=1 Tax=Lacticigenium naphthae TaxID=515351 RepID=UPI000428892E|nr:LysM domain-containing protein [Lacticigenium naphthae]
MTKKDSQSNHEELWSKRFDEENEEEKIYSRSQKRKSESEISPLAKLTFVFLILLITLPTGAYFWWTNNDVSPLFAGNESSVQVAENDTATKEEETKENEELEKAEEAERLEAEKAAQEEAKQKEAEQKEAEQAAEEESKPEEVDETTETTQPVEEEETDTQTEVVVEEESQTTPEASTKTYVVQAGDNLYRIALNNGMTTDELKELNGMTGNDVMVGTELIVE